MRKTNLWQIMTLENRVLPSGEIVADPSRGSFMGNRGGKIHDPKTKTLLPKRRWASRAWICCVLKFRDRYREVMGPGYTHLFFLDEVTALSAGHRPCFECRRKDAIAFSEAWQKAFDLAARPRANEMDLVLHDERCNSRSPRRQVAIAELPDGTVICEKPFAADYPEGTPANPYWVIRGSNLLSWSLEGYQQCKKRPHNGGTYLVSPPAIVKVLRNGYRPTWHPTAELLATADRNS